MAVNYNTRSRNWFLCVNAGAECYDHVSLICERLENCSYAYIQHDSESVTIGSEEVSSKPPHYHVLLAFDNARTFTSITKQFSGAHVEVSHVLADCAAYLLHNTENARKANKKEYHVEDIVTNNKVALLAWLGDKGLRFEVFNENRILDYIIFDNMHSISSFFLRFGASIMRWVSLIKELCHEVEKEETMATINKFTRSDVDNVNSVNQDSTNVFLYVANDCLLMSDLIIRFNRWEYIDYPCIEYMQNFYPDLYERLKLESVMGLDLSLIRSYLLEIKAKAIV